MLSSVVFLVLLTFIDTPKANDLLRVNHPESYTVRKGDTLWHISARFLNAPWRWKEVWHQNDSIKNPDLIYPGDIISLKVVDGKPRLTISDSVRIKPQSKKISSNRQTASSDSNEYTSRSGERVVKLSPKIRATSMDSIAPLPIGKIGVFIKRSMMIEHERELKQVAYIIGGRDGHLAGGAGDHMFAAGKLTGANKQKTYGIFRKGNVIKDSQTGEVLGIPLLGVGTALLKGRLQHGSFPIEIKTAISDVRQGDYLLPVPIVNIADYQPKPPKDRSVSGRIVAAIEGISQVGKFDNVIISLGKREQIKVGTVFSVLKQSNVYDRVSKQQVWTAPEKAGLLMVYEVFGKLSYGIILEATQPLAVGDKLTSPW